VAKTYWHIRYRWLKNIDIQKIASELGEDFEVETMDTKKGNNDPTVWKLWRDQLKIKANTLSALLSARRVVLYQREAMPFTEKDLKLREYLFGLYPRNRGTPLHVGSIDEPKFSVVK
jgi:hypothetical protein